VCGELLILETHEAGKCLRGDLVIVQPGTFYYAYDGRRGIHSAGDKRGELHYSPLEPPRLRCPPQTAGYR